MNAVNSAAQLDVSNATAEAYKERALAAGQRYLEAVDGILDEIRSRRHLSDELGMVPHESVALMEQAGVFRALTPMQFGGLELDPASFFEGIMKIAGADPSAAWIGGQLTVHAFEIALLDPQLQYEFWGDGPDARASSAYAPLGKWEKVEGGFLLNGTWAFSSGVDHASWVILGGGLYNFVVPRSDFTIVPDSWDVHGLKGTGSKSITLDNVFVPEYRAHSLMATYHDENPGWEINKTPLYRLSWLGMFTSTMANSAIGLTLGSIEEFIRQTRERHSKLGTGIPVSTNPFMQMRLASALTKVRGVKKRHLDNWREFFDIACAGGIPDDLDRMRVKYEATDAAGACFEAFNEIWPHVGAAVVLKSNPLYYNYIDLAAMRNHGSAARDNAALLYMKKMFGQPGPEITNMMTLGYYK